MLNVSETFNNNVVNPNKSKICFMIINTNDLLFTNSDFTDGGITIEEYFCTSEDLTYGDTPSPRLSFSVFGAGIPDGYNFFTSDTGNPIIPWFGVEVAQTDYTFGDNVLAHIEVNDNGTMRVVEGKTDGLYYDGTKIDNGVYNTLLSNNVGNFLALPQTPDPDTPQYALVDYDGSTTSINMNDLNQFMIRKFKSGASWSRTDGNMAKVWADGKVTTYELISGGWFNCEISNVSKDYIGNVYSFTDLSGVMSRNDDVTYYRMTPEQVVAYLDDEDAMKFPPVVYPMTLKTLCDTLGYLMPESVYPEFLDDENIDATQRAEIQNRFNSITFASNPFHGRSISFRQVLSWIGQITRTVIVESRASGGVLVPKWLNVVSGEVGRWLWGAMETIPYSRISSTGIAMAYRSVLPTLRVVMEAVDGTVYDFDYSGSHPSPDKYSTYYIGGNPLFSTFTSSNANAYCDGLPTYTPCDFTVIYADPSVEVGDIIKADCVWTGNTDSDGNPVFDSILFPLLHRRMTFTGVCFTAEYEASGGYQRQTNEVYDTQNRLAMNTNDIADINSQLPDFLTAATGVTSVNGSHGDVTVTDTKVTQTYASYSSYTYWRPLVIGSSAGSAETFTPSTVTNNTYTFSNLKVQPSTGTIKATTFKGDLTGTASGNVGACAGSASASGSVAFNLSNGFRGVLVVQGATSGTNGMYMVWVSGSGAITSYDIRAASGVTFTNTTGKMTLTAPSSTGIQVIWYITNGTASVA